MTQRKLKRKLNLLQLIMLGTAGTIAAEIFVLTGYAAGLVGPAAVLALIIAGLMSYAIAFDYCELATMYPVTGGGVTYVREAWGTNLLTFLVGSLDCLSSTFYAALSAVGFAWSLKVFIPALPVVPTALVTILVFIVLNILDVSNIGNIQIVLGTILLACLGIFIVAGFVAPNGFSWATFTEGDFFIHQGVAANAAKILNTVALVYCAYIGYEVIAHDAEEAENPSRNLPIAILVSLTICVLVYVLIALVTLGTVPWQQVAGSETALTDVVGNFLPKYGVPMMAVAGMIATLTSVNAALLSGTREAFTLGRSGLWPRSMSRLSRFRTPYIACWFIGAITCLVASVGMVDFLSYVSSAGLLFVLFFSNLAMIRLRKLRPNAERPFKTKLFPLTPVLAILSCFLVVSFSSWQALLFSGLVLAGCTVFYYTYKPLSRAWAERAKAHESARDRILVPVASPATAQGLARLAFVLAEASEDTSICILTINSSVTAPSSAIRGRIAGQLNPRRRVVLQQITDEARIRNAALYTKVSNSSTVAQGILDEVGGNVKLVLMGWPGPLTPQQLPDHPVKLVLQKAHAHVAVLLNRGLDNVQRILVPVGGGFHSRLALRLAYEIGFPQHAQITAVHIVCQPCDSEELEDHMLNLREIIEESLGQMPPDITTRLVYANDVLSGVLQEAQRLPYDLIVIGASEEWLSRTQLFGALTDEIAEKTTCSVLLARRYESAAMAWLKSRSRMLTGAASNAAAPAHNGGR